MTVEVLFFEGCPNHEPAMQLVRDVMAELGIEAPIREVSIETPGAAETHRFLGSPSIRVNGRDVEPGADQYADFALSCRVYGRSGIPPRKFIIAALEEARA